jgi:uncharacterized protein (TIGR02594 family)
MNISDRLYEHARKDLGLAEVPGPGSHPRIQRAIELAARWLDDDDSQTAWCGCLRGLWGLETGTGVPHSHYRAAAWTRWGKAVTLTAAGRGETVILTRPGGHHVGLFDSLSADGLSVMVLGGNQGNKVSVAPYKRSMVVGVRRGP